MQSIGSLDISRNYNFEIPFQSFLDEAITFIFYNTANIDKYS